MRRVPSNHGESDGDKKMEAYEDSRMQSRRHAPVKNLAALVTCRRLVKFRQYEPFICFRPPLDISLSQR